MLSDALAQLAEAQQELQQRDAVLAAERAEAPRRVNAARYKGIKYKGGAAARQRGQV